MAKKRDYYEVLGISKSATIDEIKKAYRALAKKYHPDINSAPDAVEKFKEATEAVEILADPEKRKIYDQYGHAGFDQNAGFGGFGGFGTSFDFSDFFGGDSGFGGFSSIFKDIFGEGFGSSSSSRGSRQRGRSSGEDLNIKVDLTFKELVFGTTKNIVQNVYEKCSECNGKGAKNPEDVVTCNECNGKGVSEVIQNFGGMRFSSTQTCQKCYGNGKIIKTPCNVCKGKCRVLNKKTIEVEIPKGVRLEHKLVQRQSGHAAEGGGVNGDLNITINLINKNNRIKYDDNGNIIYVLNINYIDAILGNKIIVKTLDGDETVSIPAGIVNNTILTIKNKGMYHSINSKSRADLLLMVNIVVPKKPTSEEIKKLKELDALNINNQVNDLND